VVRREVPTTTMSCWGEPEARKIIGSEIEYSEKMFRWSSIITNDPVAESKVITAPQFHDDNSGGSVNSSQVDFRQLGIKQSQTGKSKFTMPTLTSRLQQTKSQETTFL
jgi:hypothetical protein